MGGGEKKTTDQPCIFLNTCSTTNQFFFYLSGKQKGKGTDQRGTKTNRRGKGQAFLVIYPQFMIMVGEEKELMKRGL